jgi:hypothetical protein
MTIPSETQTLILSRASCRAGNLALPLPEGLAGAAAKMVVGKMIARSWIEEVEANLRCGEPLWRETGDGHGTTLIATGAGLEAIGIEPVVARAVASARKAKPVLAPPPDAPVDPTTPEPVTIRAGTKEALVIALLPRSEGATIAEIVAATAWQAHTAYVERPAVQVPFGTVSRRETVRSYVRPVCAAFAAGLDEVHEAGGWIEGMRSGGASWVSACPSSGCRPVGSSSVECICTCWLAPGSSWW